MKRQSFSKFLIVVAAVFLGFNCRHARVTLPPPLPSVCIGATTSSQIISCESAKARQKTTLEQNSSKRETKVFTHKYMFWGLKPKNITYNGADICQQGIYKIHEYSTWKDGLFAEITLGILMPRTLEIICY